MKKGISLVTLVITIVVLIILSSAVVFMLNNTNPIQSAKDAVTASNIATIKEEFAISKARATTRPNVFGLSSSDQVKNLNIEGNDLEKWIPSIKTLDNLDYTSVIKIDNGNLDVVLSEVNKYPESVQNAIIEGITGKLPDKPSSDNTITPEINDNFKGKDNVVYAYGKIVTPIDDVNSWTSDKPIYNDKFITLQNNNFHCIYTKDPVDLSKYNTMIVRKTNFVCSRVAVFSEYPERTNASGTTVSSSNYRKLADDIYVIDISELTRNDLKMHITSWGSANAGDISYICFSERTIDEVSNDYLFAYKRQLDNSYTLNFETNVNSVKVNSVTTDTGVVKLPDLTGKNGDLYFLGWSESKDGSGRKYKRNFEFEGNKTLYAVWGEGKYTDDIIYSYGNMNKNILDANTFSASKPTYSTDCITLPNGGFYVIYTEDYIDLEKYNTIIIKRTNFSNKRRLGFLQYPNLTNREGQSVVRDNWEKIDDVTYVADISTETRKDMKFFASAYNSDGSGNIYYVCLSDRTVEEVINDPSFID